MGMGSTDRAVLKQEESWTLSLCYICPRVHKSQYNKTRLGASLHSTHAAAGTNQSPQIIKSKVQRLLKEMDG